MTVHGADEHDDGADADYVRPDGVHARHGTSTNACPPIRVPQGNGAALLRQRSHLLPGRLSATCSLAHCQNASANMGQLATRGVTLTPN